MLIPYSTDAPIYHWPIATVSLIVINVAVFFGAVAMDIDVEETGWVMWYGDGIHPNQWVQSIFMHGGILHLAFNMLFLWIFGLVIEGKLGWWRFLCCYLAIGIGESAIEQLIMIRSEPQPGSLGASAAIFGLIAMAAIWAPKNEISCILVFGFRPYEFDISIAVLAGLYAGQELVWICIFGSEAGASWWHILGFIAGLPIAIVLLKQGIVDCEGWDAFNVWKGNTGAFKKETPAREVLAQADASRKKKDEELLLNAEKQFRTFLQQGNVPAAILLFEKMKPVRGGIKPRQKEWLAMIQTLHAEKRWADSAPYMASSIAAFPEGADALRVKLAQICVVELQRPGRALDLLDDVKTVGLPEKQAEMLKRIRAKAHAMQDEGIVELDDDAW